MKDDYHQANKQLWNHWTDLHYTSEFYDVAGLRNGRCSLCEIEIDEVGDVRDKTLLHLQCHFGMDTLSWARRGANVVGVDYSKVAIDRARDLAKDIGVPAEFICSAIETLPGALDRTFDIVFTSAGVLPWLESLERWGEVIATFLKPGGFFFLREFHPFVDIFDRTTGGDCFEIKHPYFKPEHPTHFVDQVSYAVTQPSMPLDKYEWPHTISDVLNALITAGLSIEYMHEFNYVGYQRRPFLSRDKSGRWVFAPLPGALPLQFSIKAVRR